MHLRIALLLLATQCATACTVNVRGELTQAQCGDKTDNDGDKMVDCKDPDCFSLDICRLDGALSRVGDGGGLVPGEDAGAADASFDAAPEFDGNVRIKDADVESCSQTGCPATELCINGSCVPAGTAPGTYLLSVTSGTVPDVDRIQMCYDLDCLSPIPFAVCQCPPDPYVVTTLIRGTEEFVVGITDAIPDETKPSWNHEPYIVVIENGDMFRLEAYDYDPNSAHPRLLDCSVTPTDDPVGDYSCGNDFHKLHISIAAPGSP